jgi:soluble lytic murein transglycosylase
LAQAALRNEDFATAAGHFEALRLAFGDLSAEQQQEALLGLALAYLRSERPAQAADVLDELVAAAGGPGSGSQSLQPATEPHPALAHFFLAQAHQQQADCPAALEAYQAYLDANPDMAAYIFPRMAGCYTLLGDRAATVAAYEAALASAAHRLVIVAIRQQLASFYLEDGDFPAAVAQYQAIHDIAQTENTRGQMSYLAGSTELRAGNTEAGYAYYQAAINNYPRAYESYLAVIELLDAGVPVNDFQRGLVDYYAAAYRPALDAFDAYLAANEAEHREDVHLYLAWSHEQLGNLTAAIEEATIYMDSMGTNSEEVARGQQERAEIWQRAGRLAEAAADYRDLVENYPTANAAPIAAWRGAFLTEQLGDSTTAVALYQQMASAYPAHEDAPEALFRAGLVEQEAGRAESGLAIWESLVSTYPHHPYGAAATFWLIKTLPAEQAQPYIELAAGQWGENYYALRARHLASGVPPFAPPEAIELDYSEQEGRAEAEAWLLRGLGLDEATPLPALSPELAADERLIVGAKLWQLGLRSEAKLELEALRVASGDSALNSFQLAVFFRDLGLYRSSIIAAANVLALMGASVFDAPAYIGRLAYPAYFADLIVPHAERYGFDPLLQFALVRQESLFESFATSYAAAQRLSQVIPDTGAYIAQELNWPDYDNEDLYRPYVGLAFGAFYLSEQLEAFDNNVAVALSAYNGGPGNAARWYRQAPDDFDRYVETVDFWETRTYVERIYIGHSVYRFLYGASESPAE